VPAAAKLAVARPADASSGAQAPAATRDEDADALARLKGLMDREQVWRETGLTIGGLAGRVGVPEYRLRRLINQRLEFRNFTAFLNEYRLAAAADRLGDPKHARMPILTIALDLGWASVGPFNRAFRARYGIPPSDFRRQRSDGEPSTAET
jgi:AraC-like DNA-binding protein